MQYVNDDMDDLFRRAAEKYPLDTSTSDWNKVAAALVNPMEQVVAEKKNRSFRWLIMFIPLSLICHLVIAPDPLLLNKSRSGTSGVSHQNKTKAVLPVSVSEPGNAAPSAPDIVFSDSKIQKDKSVSLPSVVTGKHRIADENKLSLSAADQSQKSGVSENDSGNYLTSLPISPKQQWMLQPLYPSGSKIVSASQNPSRLKQKRFYAGIMGGIDASTVKFQKVETAGYDAGILVGYELNRKWSVEAGFSLDRKFYYTKADYFNKSKIGYMPPNSWITELEGNCSMFEVPVSLKFNISRNKKSSWFTTAGVSSYIMKKEDYSYVYYYATPGTYATHNKSYKNTSTDLFSALTFSAGYTHRIGRTFDMRLEPYVKLPITGMGFGSLPLTSGGFRAGITRKLF